MIEHNTGKMLFQIGIVLLCFLAVRQSEPAKGSGTEVVHDERRSNAGSGFPRHHAKAIPGIPSPRVNPGAKRMSFLDQS